MNPIIDIVVRLVYAELEKCHRDHTVRFTEHVLDECNSSSKIQSSVLLNSSDYKPVLLVVFKLNIA